MTKKLHIIFIISLFIACSVARQRIEIADYIVVENGKKAIGIKPLHAFIFENKLSNIPFQKFIASKYNTQNNYEPELWITIEKEKYKLLFYSIDEFEKFFNSQNYTAIIQENDAEKYGNQSKFIAISMTNEKGEDCLSNNSLYLNVAKKYLKNLKNEYLKPL